MTPFFTYLHLVFKGGILGVEREILRGLRKWFCITMKMTENWKGNKKKMKMHSFIQQIFVKKLPLSGVFLGTGDKVLKKTG